MPQLKRKNILDLSGAVQNKTVIPLSLGNQVLHAMNAEFTSKLGAATGRPGSAVQSTVVAAQRILNILQWIKNDGTKKYFASVSDGAETPKVDTYINAAVLAGAWSKSLEDWTNLVDVFGANFANKLMVFNGADAPKAWDGASWAAITNAPTAGKFPDVYKQRLFVLTESGFLHYSDVINSTGSDFTTTTWLNRGINPNDGQICKMMKRHRNRLVILKTESIYRYDGSNEPESNINVGTHSGKSVVILGDLYFHSPFAGICRLGSGEPVPISRVVQKYLDGMLSANWEYVAAGRDSQNLYFWIGNVTISDPLEWDYNKTYSDVVLVFNVYAQTWTVFRNWNARTWFFDETTGSTYFGTAAGKIVKINTGYADVDGETTTPISFEVVFNPQTYGYPEKEKEFGLIEVIGKYNSNVLIADDPDKMQNAMKVGQSEGIGVQTCKELWVGVAEQYVDKPPRVEGLILDNVNLLDDAN